MKEFLIGNSCVENSSLKEIFCKIIDEHERARDYIKYSSNKEDNKKYIREILDTAHEIVKEANDAWDNTNYKYLLFLILCTFWQKNEENKKKIDMEQTISYEEAAEDIKWICENFESENKEKEKEIEKAFLAFKEDNEKKNKRGKRKING